MTLQEYEAQGGCEGCYFYGTIDVDGRKGCTFHWFDDESEDWDTARIVTKYQTDSRNRAQALSMKDGNLHPDDGKLKASRMNTVKT